MTKKVLTAAAAGEIRRLRAELNDWLEPKWTGSDIARQLGVSEATVWRVLKEQAAYAPGKRAVGEELSMNAAHARVGELNPLERAEADAILARIQASLGLPGGQSRLQAEAAKAFVADGMIDELRVPPNPLDE